MKGPICRLWSTSTVRIAKANIPACSRIVAKVGPAMPDLRSCAPADRDIEIRQDGQIVGQHPRSFSRGKVIYDPWHYVPVLARKPGALRNGAPFKDWILPANLARVRKKLGSTDDGDRQMVKILTTVLTDGLAVVEAACQEALDDGVHSADVILNILARRREIIQPLTIATPLNATVVPRSALKLRHEPVAANLKLYCARYDRLRRAV